MNSHTEANFNQIKNLMEQNKQLSNLGKYDEAISLLEKAEKIMAVNVHLQVRFYAVYIQKALLYVKKRNFVEAHRLLVRAQKFLETTKFIDEKHRPSLEKKLLMGFAKYYSKCGDSAAAIKMLERVSKDDLPEDDFYWRFYDHVLYGSDSRDIDFDIERPATAYFAAKGKIEKFKELKISDSNYQSEKQIILDLLAELHKKHPKFQGGNLIYANFLFDIREYEKALVLLQEVKKDENYYFQGLYAEGRSADLSGNQTHAINCFLEIIDAEDKKHADASAKYNFNHIQAMAAHSLGCIYCEDVNLKKWYEYANIAIKKDKNYAPAYSLRAKWFRNAKQESKAIIDFEKARSLNMRRFNENHDTSLNIYNARRKSVGDATKEILHAPNPEIIKGQRNIFTGADLKIAVHATQAKKKIVPKHSNNNTLPIYQNPNLLMISNPFAQLSKKKNSDKTINLMRDDSSVEVQSIEEESKQVKPNKAKHKKTKQLKTPPRFEKSCKQLVNQAVHDISEKGYAFFSSTLFMVKNIWKASDASVDALPLVNEEKNIPVTLEKLIEPKPLEIVSTPKISSPVNLENKPAQASQTFFQEAKVRADIVKAFKRYIKKLDEDKVQNEETLAELPRLL